MPPPPAAVLLLSPPGAPAPDDPEGPAPPADVGADPVICGGSGASVSGFQPGMLRRGSSGAAPATASPSSVRQQTAAAWAERRAYGEWALLTARRRAAL